ncbi:unnamed protein product [Ceratitis capitata]|uniref:(Mediterranean fruit fly) hypothetical protein n=1 Tax=Ceratitis capitata TaxID=7213 RepID=A0A811UCV4_CERCA|nr:unnamed protein product [Ceratitis capitata]
MQRATKLLVIKSECHIPLISTQVVSSRQTMPPKIMILPADSKQSVIFRADSAEDLKTPMKLMIIPSCILDTSKTVKSGVIQLVVY